MKFMQHPFLVKCTTKRVFNRQDQGEIYNQTKKYVSHCYDLTNEWYPIDIFPLLQ